MANLAAAREDLRKDGVLTAYAVKTNVKIYKGGLVAVDSTGYVKPAAAGDKSVVGVAYETIDNTGGANGAKKVRVWQQGSFEFNASGLTQANVGDLVYVTDDNTVQTSATSTILVGRIVEFVSATKCRVDITQRA